MITIIVTLVQAALGISRAERRWHKTTEQMQTKYRGVLPADKSHKVFLTFNKEPQWRLAPLKKKGAHSGLNTSLCSAYESPLTAYCCTADRPQPSPVTFFDRPNPAPVNT